MSTITIPTFTVETVAGDRAGGTFEPSNLIGERSIGCLMTERPPFVWGRFVGLDGDRATLLLRDPNDAARLTLGANYRYLDGYWGERAELVLDESLVWRRHAWEPRDVEPPLDHEHCAICWQKVGTSGDDFGYENQREEWICERCHAEYVTPRSLAFIVEAEAPS